MVAVADLGGGAIASTNLDRGLELVGPTSLALKRSPTTIVVGVLWETSGGRV